MFAASIRTRVALAALAALLLDAGPPVWAREPGSAAAAKLPVIDLPEFRGKVVYLDFWASWCVPCRQSFPWMNAMQKQYGKDGFVVVAVNMDQQRGDADAFLQKYPAGFLVRFDPEGHLARSFNLRGMPTSVLLDRDGRTVLVHEGFRSGDSARLEESIRMALH